jgi:SWI/SNF-related matrix-associated actin-dependent regulator of chromatin subfamily A3
LILVKNSNKFIKNSFDIPEPIEKTYLCKLPPNYLIARRFLSGPILEKINANDFAGAIRELGGKSDTEDNIIELVSRELKKDLWNKERERVYINDLDISEDDKQQKLKKLDIEIEIQKHKIDDLAERIKSLSSDNCVICMDTVKNPIMLECTHLFCGGCIMNWIQRNNNCPYCRTRIASYNNLIAIVNQNSSTNPTEEILYKEDTFLSIIKNKPDGKFLVFTRNDNGFELIRKKMIDEGIKFEFLKGNTQHMKNVLDKFKSGEIKIILLNTQYAGSGIDINYATDVIIYHSMGIDKQQAVGRAQRAGRKEQLYIHNLCYEHEI